jgi:adenylate kinase
MDLSIFGVQGSGKGTQAKRLAAEFGYYVFETGGELRKIIASGSELGKLVASYLDKGNLAPLEVVMQVAKEAIAARPADQSILFDGIPRDMAQKEGFDKILQEAGRHIRCVELVLPKEIAIERILGRAKIEGRADDANIDAIQRRLQVFEERTRPVIEAYAADGNMVFVDGLGSMDDVYERLKAVVIGL